MDFQRMQNNVINFLNFLSDKDSGWFPFLFLRPEKNEKIGLKQLLKISFAFGGLAGLFFGAALAFVTVGTPGSKVFLVGVCILGWMAFIFALWGMVFASAWNIRAQSLPPSEKNIL